MNILILAEHANGHLAEQTAQTLTAAYAIGGDIDILVCGRDVAEVAKRASMLEGVRNIYLADAEVLSGQLAEPVAETILAIAERYEVFIAPASTNGKNIMPRVAAKLDVMQISDVVDIIEADTFKHPIYAGNAIETVRSLDKQIVLTVRTSSFKQAQTGGSAPIITIEPAVCICGTRHLRDDISKSERPELSSAKTVVSGGRGLGSKENFESLILPLADKLHGAVGASRAAVDAGFASNDWQVGQTGKIVAPDLYIAIGISGAIQHIAGMGDSRVIVAINKDEDAPIMQIADYSIVGDLFELVPEFSSAV